MKRLDMMDALRGAVAEKAGDETAGKVVDLMAALKAALAKDDRPVYLESTRDETRIEDLDPAPSPTIEDTEDARSDWARDEEMLAADGESNLAEAEDE